MSKYRSVSILVFLIIVKFVLQYAVVLPLYELHRDEYLHLDQGRHLAWGFVSVPPFTSWIAWIIFRLGGSEFWVKFFPALFGALTMLVTWKIVEELNGRLFARVIAALAILFSVILRINTLFQPNSFDILAWTLMYYLLIRIINRNDNRLWIWMGVILGLGFLNKYSILFLVLGLLPALLLSSERSRLLQKKFWLGVGVAFLLVLPNLVWQINHDFPVVHHMKELAETQLVNVNRADFIKEQVLYFLGGIWLFVFTIYGFVSNPGLKRFRFIGYSYLFTMALFLFFQAKGYYTIGLYPVLLAIGAVQLERTLASGWMRYLRPLFIVLLIGSFFPIFKIAFPVVTPEEIKADAAFYKDLGLLRWEDGRDHDLPQDYADMLGWKELAHIVDSSVSAIPNSGYTLVLCDNYGQAGAINYYSRNKAVQAVSMNADYINWIPFQKDIRNVVLVQESSDDDPQRKREQTLFRKVYYNGEIRNRWARERGTKVYSCVDATTPIAPILLEEARDRQGFSK